MNRRSLLVTSALGIASPLGGCTAAESDEANAAVTRPEECPVTQGFDIPSPEEPTESEVQMFVREYERAYLSESRGSSVPNSASPRVQDVEETNAGIIVRLQTTWSTRTLIGTGISAEPQETVPEETTAIAVESLPEELEQVADVAREAAATDERTYWSHEGKDRESILSVLDDEYETERGDGYENPERYYLTVDDNPVRIEITAASEGYNDGGVLAQYFVNEAVVRRTSSLSRDPSEGELLECLSIGNN